MFWPHREAAAAARVPGIRRSSRRFEANEGCGGVSLGLVQGYQTKADVCDSGQHAVTHCKPQPGQKHHTNTVPPPPISSWDRNRPRMTLRLPPEVSPLPPP
ncbi:unnamed protein product [Knipowitschia caucasica]|uniref:Uncharacterized protein n=1 Tax=Knipowitschia caucasica TaxID=637954 RepID=A0AAV2LDY0_KNICA